MTAPANGNVAPPGYYMLFIVNANGVPSVGAFVRCTGTDRPDAADGVAHGTGSRRDGQRRRSRSQRTPPTTSASRRSTFEVDSTPIGPPDATAPYSVQWDTTRLANGTHTLTAVASEPTGNSTTSYSVAGHRLATRAGPSGLVAAYGFDEGRGRDGADQSGNGNNGDDRERDVDGAGKFGKAL